MAIYRNVIVEIPNDAYVEKDAAVFVKDRNEYDPVKKYNRVRHTIIGRSIGDGRMYPNHNFRLRYPALFESASGEKLPKQTKKIGLYTIILSIVEKNGLYDALIRSYGIENANMILDFSMYSILHHSCVADQYSSKMEDQLLFSSDLWSPSKLCGFFNKEITEEKTSRFRKMWVEKCRGRDISGAWIAIDGSNNDCEAQQADIVERGKAKSLKNVTIVSYMYAVDSRNGDPITFSIYRGGRVDCRAVMEMIGWLKAYDIEVEGVIVDRGFATKDLLELFDQNGIEYVAMLKGDTLAHTEMVERYANKIRMQYEFMLGRYRPEEKATEIAKDARSLYGTEEPEKIRLFSSHSYKAYASLIYDSANGGERQEAWFRKVSNTAMEIQQALEEGKKMAVPQKYADCIKIEETNGKKTVMVDTDHVQGRGDRKGFCCLASSRAMTAEESNHIYTLRNSSEEQFSMVKSQLGYGTTGTHYTEGIKAKLTLAFIAAIIRNELVKVCRHKDQGLSTNRAIQEANQICMYLDGKEEYFICHTESQRQIAFMKACGVHPNDLEHIAGAENKRMASPEPSPFHQYPVHAVEDEPVRKGPGRPKGSKNRITKKKTESKVKEKRKPGRPPGAKNRKTLE